MRTKHTCPKVTSCTSNGCGGYTYSFNAAGQKIGSVSTISGDPAAGTTSYQYDQLSRLTGYTPPTDAATKTQTYAWNATPDRASVTTGTAAALTMTYDAASHPVGGSYASDLEGRITKMPAPDGTDTLTLTWDILGRLTKVSDSNGTNTTYGYDPLDRLETITSGSGTTSLVYVGLTDALATSTSGGVTTVHANDLDGTELYEYSVTSGSSDHPTPAYLERDDHGDVTWTTDESGAPSGHAAYDPFGGLTSSSAGFPSTRWQGSWYEANSGLYYVIARWYSPPLGEFLSDDPLIHDTTDPQARDPYAYASGDPIDGSDPSGQCTWGPDVNIGCTVAYKYTPGPKSATTGQPPVTKQQPPATAPTAKTLVVPWFPANGKNAPWAGLPMGTCGHTVGEKGCLVTSAAMVVARHAPVYKSTPPYAWTPTDMIKFLNTKKEIGSDCSMVNYSWSKWGVKLTPVGHFKPGIVDPGGLNRKMRGTRHSVFRYIETQINANRPVIAQVKAHPMHFVVIIGYNDKGDLVMNDSLAGTGGTRFFKDGHYEMDGLIYVSK